MTVKPRRPLSKFHDDPDILRGTYRKVSRHWLQDYLNEFVWRWNARYSPSSMFETLLDRATA